MTYSLYILHSSKIDRFYIGVSNDVPQWVDRHNSDFYSNAWFKRGIPWQLVLQYKCESKSQALFIERFIKKMKSKAFIRRLIDDPKIIQDIAKKSFEK